MESREVFLLLHLLPFHWVGGGGLWQKGSLSFSRILLPGFSSYKQTQCSRSSVLAVLTPFCLVFKRRVFSQTPLSPPFFNPGEEGWSGAGLQWSSVLHWRAWDPPPSGTVRPMSTEMSGIWNASSTGTTSRRWKRSSTGLYLQGSCSDSSLTHPQPPKWNTLLTEAPWGRI